MRLGKERERRASVVSLTERARSQVWVRLSYAAALAWVQTSFAVLRKVRRVSRLIRWRWV